MFIRLLLHNFGKFRNSEFALGPVTAFFGPNEAGKSTLFDAFFQALCQPSGSTSDGKRLRERYGETARASLHDARGEIKASLAHDEFLSTYAVHSGNVHIKMKGRFFQQATAELFESDVRMDKAIKMLNDLASDKASFGAARARLRLRSERQSLSERFQTCDHERLALVSRRKQDQERGQRIAWMDQELQRAEKQLRLAEDAMRDFDAAARRSVLVEALSKLNRIKDLQRELADLKPFAEDDGGALDLLLQENTAAAAAAEAAQKRALEASEARIVHDRSIESLKKQTGAMLQASQLAGAQLAALATSPAVSSKLRRGRLAVTLGLAAAGVALLAYAFWGGDVYALVVGGLLLFGSALHIVVRPHRESKLDPIRLQTLQAEWRSLDLPEPAAFTQQSYEEELRRRENEAMRYEERLGLSQQRDAELAQDEERSAGEQAAAAAAVQRIKEELRQWLQSRGVATPEQYKEKRLAWLEKSGRIAFLREELQSVAAARELREAEVEWQSELAQLGAGGARQAPDPEGQYKLKSAHSAARQRREELIQQLAAERESSASDRGETQGALGRVLAEWNDLQQQALRLEADLLEKEQEQRAAGIARGLLADLQQMHSYRTVQLVEAVNHSLSGLFPETQRARVNENAAELELQLADAQGEARSIDYLSAGTRDSFFFALRLALAARVGVDGRLLLLDEPFLTLDANRAERALKYALHFAEEKSCQLVLFTKEQALLELLQNSAPEYTLHRLSSSA
ncbi:MAG: AAA family ATPase [Leptospirales bacterium]|nr:AAA family ATPase [Leptospirales bacterium]